MPPEILSKTDPSKSLDENHTIIWEINYGDDEYSNDYVQCNDIQVLPSIVDQSIADYLPTPKYVEEVCVISVSEAQKEIDRLKEISVARCEEIERRILAENSTLKNRIKREAKRLSRDFIREVIPEDTSKQKERIVTLHKEGFMDEGQFNSEMDKINTNDKWVVPVLILLFILFLIFTL